MTVVQVAPAPSPQRKAEPPFSSWTHSLAPPPARHSSLVTVGTAVRKTAVGSSTVISGLISSASSALGGGGGEKKEGRNLVRAVTPIINIEAVDERKTLLSHFVGKKAQQRFSTFFRRYRPLLLLDPLAIFVSLACMGGTLASSSASPEETEFRYNTAYGCWLGFYPLLKAVTQLNYDIVRRLLTQFETWFLMVETTVFMVLMCFIVDWDIRCVGVFFVSFAILVVIFYDALPPNTKTLEMWGFIIFVAILWEGAVASMIGEVESKAKEMLEERDMQTGGSWWSVTQGLAANRLYTLTAFFARNLYCMAVYPSSFIVLKSRLSFAKRNLISLRAIASNMMVIREDETRDKREGDGRRTASLSPQGGTARTRREANNSQSSAAEGRSSDGEKDRSALPEEKKRFHRLSATTVIPERRSFQRIGEITKAGERQRGSKPGLLGAQQISDAKVPTAGRECGEKKESDMTAAKRENETVKGALSPLFSGRVPPSQHHQTGQPPAGGQLSLENAKRCEGGGDTGVEEAGSDGDDDDHDLDDYADEYLEEEEEEETAPSTVPPPIWKGGERPLRLSGGAAGGMARSSIQSSISHLSSVSQPRYRERNLPSSSQAGGGPERGGGSKRKPQMMRFMVPTYEPKTFTYQEMLWNSLFGKRARGRFLSCLSLLFSCAGERKGEWLWEEYGTVLVAGVYALSSLLFFLYSFPQLWEGEDQKEAYFSSLHSLSLGSSVVSILLQLVLMLDLNALLVKELLRSFDVWFLLGTSLSSFLLLSHAFFSWDARSLMVFNTILAVVLCVLHDAAYMEKRWVHASWVFTTWVTLLQLSAVLFLVFSMEKKPLLLLPSQGGKEGGESNDQYWDPSIYLLNRFYTLGAFLLRNLVNNAYNKEIFLMLRSALSSRKKEVSEVLRYTTSMAEMAVTPLSPSASTSPLRRQYTGWVG